MKIKCTHCGRWFKSGKRRCPHCKQEVAYSRPLKKRLPWFFKMLFIIAAAVLAVIFLWYAFGNVLLLNIHAHYAVSEINSGSIEFTKSENEAYGRLPEYVKSMLDTPEPEDDGPIMKAMLPYIRAEVAGVNGLFGGREITLRVFAPDLEAFLEDLDINTVSSSDELQSMLLNYIPSAPLRSEEVTVSCFKKSIFTLEGVWDDEGFVNALYGGFNSAYADFYTRAVNEIKEALA